MLSAFLLTITLTAAPAPKDAVSSTADWPQWRGPNRDGKSQETGLVIPKGAPKLLWESDKIGTGYGQPSVVGNRLYLIGADGGKAGNPEFFHALDLTTGKEIWKKPLNTSPGKFNDGWGGGPRSAPTIHDGQAYVLGATGDLVCFDAESGAELWKKNLVSDFGGKIPTWGYSESPLLDDGKVVVTPGNGTGMVALDAKNGKDVWTCKDFTDGAGYSSIMTMMKGSTKLYIQQTMQSAIGVNAKTGKMAFKTGEIKRATAVIPTPVIFKDYVFFTAGYGAGCECYKVAGEGDKITAEKVYSNSKAIANHHGGVIALEDKVYGHGDRIGWMCLPFTKTEPEAAWTSGKLGKGAISYADGHFFCYEEDSGTVAIIKADSEKWDEVGRFKIPKTSTTRPRQGKVWAHPVIAQGKLILRDYDLLFVYDLRAKP